MAAEVSMVITINNAKMGRSIKRQQLLVSNIG